MKNNTICDFNFMPGSIANFIFYNEESNEETIPVKIVDSFINFEGDKNYIVEGSSLTFSKSGIVPIKLPFNSVIMGIVDADELLPQGEK